MPHHIHLIGSDHKTIKGKETFDDTMEQLREIFKTEGHKYAFFKISDKDFNTKFHYHRLRKEPPVYVKMAKKAL